MKKKNKNFIEAFKEGDIVAAAALADKLEEEGDKIGAAQWRAKAGLSRVIYQVYDPKENKVKAEYKTIGACNAKINRFGRDYRRSLVIKVVEFMTRVVGEMPVDLKKIEKHEKKMDEIRKQRYSYPPITLNLDNTNA